MTSGNQHIGAYGLRLLGLDGAREMLVPARESWPELAVERRVGGPFNHGVDAVSATKARLQLVNGGEIAIDWTGRRVTVTTPRSPTDAELVHPYLAPVAAIMSYWLMRESFHAGAFVVGDRVWAILGDRESGKSSTLAWLAESGHAIVCDDMLVLDEKTALAGPRSLDLRKEAAEALGVGEPLGVVGARERWRLTLEPVRDELPVAGFVFLDWGEQVSARPLLPSERVVRLSTHRGVRLPPRDAARMLTFAGLPGWEITRPRGWDSLAAAGDRLLEIVSG
jgi:hypothetical protein